MTTLQTISTFIIGKRYYKLTKLTEKARYLTMAGIFTVSGITLAVFGSIMLGIDQTRALINMSIAGICLLTITLMRTKMPLRVLSSIPVTLFGVYCLYLLYTGGLFMWAAVWIIAFPLISIFLCQMLVGLVESVIMIIVASIMMNTPGMAVYDFDPQMKTRFIAGFLLVLFITVIFEYVNVLKDKKEEKLNEELMIERDKLQDKIDHATNEISGHLQKVTKDGKQLNSVIIESSQALGVIKGNVEYTLTETNSQLSSVDQISEYVSQIVGSIDNLEGAVISQASHINDSSSSIEEMVANIESIRSVVNSISKTADTLSKSSTSGNLMLQKLAEEIDHLHERSNMLQEANKIIEDIAAKTNLLAMNAAIEAAHAGDTGKGFAVVSTEVRKLAESASKESKGIAEEIKLMEASIKSITSVTDETVQAMNLIFSEITAMDRAFAQVNNAVEEQTTGGAQILSALKSIKEETEKVRNGSEDIHKQSVSISREMELLQKISENVTKRVTEVNDASIQISNFLDDAKEIVSA